MITVGYNRFNAYSDTYLEIAQKGEEVEILMPEGPTVALKVKRLWEEEKC